MSNKIVVSNIDNRNAAKIARDNYELNSLSSRERESSYDSSLIKIGRRVGNTTRLADRAIQIVLSGKICIVSDHHYGVIGDSTESRELTHRRASEYLFRIIMKRLALEHNMQLGVLVADRQYLEIYLKQQYLDDIRDKK